MCKNCFSLFSMAQNSKLLLTAKLATINERELSLIYHDEM